MEAVPSFVARVAYLHAKLRTVLFFLFCMRATLPFLLKLQSLQTSLQSCPSHLLHRVISFVLLCYSRCGSIVFLYPFPPQAAEALQVAAREAREVSVAITCVEPRSPHAQAARGRISSMEHRERIVWGKFRICASSPLHAVLVLLPC